MEPQRSTGTEADALAQLSSRDRMNPELEVNDSHSPVTVRIVGLLHRSTGPLLLAAMGKLFRERFSNVHRNHSDGRNLQVSQVRRR